MADEGKALEIGVKMGYEEPIDGTYEGQEYGNGSESDFDFDF